MCQSVPSYRLLPRGTYQPITTSWGANKYHRVTTRTTINTKLSWQPHVNKVQNKASKTLGLTKRLTGRVGSVTTSAVKSLDASAKSLDASAKYFGRVGEIFWTRRRNPWTRRRNILDASAKSLDPSAAFWSPRRHKIGCLGKDTTSATHFFDT